MEILRYRESNTSDNEITQSKIDHQNPKLFIITLELILAMKH